MCYQCCQEKLLMKTSSRSSTESEARGRGGGANKLTDKVTSEHFNDKTEVVMETHELVHFKHKKKLNAKDGSDVVDAFTPSLLLWLSSGNGKHVVDLINNRLKMKTQYYFGPFFFLFTFNFWYC